MSTALATPRASESSNAARARLAKVAVPPIVEEHRGIRVVRDDLYPGGTKARVFEHLFKTHGEIVYASPAEGAAQSALAYAAKKAGKAATVFVAHRTRPHPRTMEAHSIGAKVLQVTPGHLNVVQARARSYAHRNGAFLLPFGGDLREARDVIAAAALTIKPVPDEVWCASGSGVLIRSLALAWPRARLHAVQVGRALTADDVAGATIHVYPKPYSYALADPLPPFPADQHYEAKAWLLCRRHHTRDANVLFWSVAGPPSVPLTSYPS